MALPTITDLETLDYSYRGEPFANVEAKSLSTITLDYSYRGEPFVGAIAAAAGGSAIKTFNELVYASAGKVNELALASVGKWNELV